MDVIKNLVFEELTDVIICQLPEAPISMFWRYQGQITQLLHDPGPTCVQLWSLTGLDFRASGADYFLGRCLH